MKNEKWSLSYEIIDVSMTLLLIEYKYNPMVSENLGCFKDHPTKRMMKWGGHYDSVMQCVQICIKKNYQYVGLQVSEIRLLLYGH